MHFRQAMFDFVMKTVAADLPGPVHAARRGERLVDRLRGVSSRAVALIAADCARRAPSSTRTRAWTRGSTRTTRFDR